MHWHSSLCGPTCAENAHKEMVDGGPNRKECLHTKGGRPIQSITLELYSWQIYFLFYIVTWYKVMTRVISTWYHSRLFSWKWEAWYECLKINVIVQKKTFMFQTDLKTSYSGKLKLLQIYIPKPAKIHYYFIFIFTINLS